MGDETLQEKIVDIIADRLGKETSEITTDSTFVDDLKADSLDRVELIMAFEEEFDIEIPDDVAEKIVSVKDAIEYLEKVLE